MRTVLHVLKAVLLFVLIGLAGQMATNLAKEYDYIGVPEVTHTVTVSGEGSATGIPDVARMRLGLSVERSTVLEAQDENTRVMDELVTELRSLGVETKDIQTSDYSVYPVYDYADGRQSLRGYQVSQSVRVTVRNLDNVGKALSLVGRLELNQVGGIEFTVDDPDDLRAQAREEAVADAKRKAQELADAVGVTLGRIVGIQESFSSGLPPGPIFAREQAMGMGGGNAAEVQPGSAEVMMTTVITYELIN